MDLVTTTPDYDQGSIVRYTNLLGQTVEVVVFRRDSIHGRPGFDGLVFGAAEDPRSIPTVWGYDDQITEIVRR